MVNHRVCVGDAHALKRFFDELVGAQEYIAMYTAYLLLETAGCGGPCFDRCCMRGSQDHEISVSIVLCRRERVHAGTKEGAEDAVDSSCTLG